MIAIGENATHCIMYAHSTSALSDMMKKCNEFMTLTVDLLLTDNIEYNLPTKQSCSVGPLEQSISYISSQHRSYICS